MCQTTTLEALRGQSAPVPAVPAGNAVTVSMDTVGGFEALQRIAKLFSSSNLVPQQFQGNIPNTFIAVDMAMRMGANPLMVCQNLYIVHGKPGWSAQFLIATLNKSGKFSALRYAFEGEQGKDNWGCRAVATELATGEKIEGPLVTLGMAKKEGWVSKNGSKWQTMPELMLRYRAATWFVRAYAPEIAMGLQTADELHDVYDVPAEDVQVVQPRRNIRKKADQQPEAEVEAEQKEDAPETVDILPDPPEEIIVEPKRHEPAMVAPDGFIDCPAKGRMVETDDCSGCTEREGCPAWQIFPQRG